MDDRPGVRRGRLRRRLRQPGGVRDRISPAAERAGRRFSRCCELAGSSVRDRVSGGRLGRAVGHGARERSPFGDAKRPADLFAGDVPQPGTDPEHPVPEQRATGPILDDRLRERAGAAPRRRPRRREGHLLERRGGARRSRGRRCVSPGHHPRGPGPGPRLHDAGPGPRRLSRPVDGRGRPSPEWRLRDGAPRRGSVDTGRRPVGPRRCRTGPCRLLRRCVRPRHDPRALRQRRLDRGSRRDGRCRGPRSVGSAVPGRGAERRTASRRRRPRGSAMAAGVPEARRPRREPLSEG